MLTQRSAGAQQAYLQGHAAGVEAAIRWLEERGHPLQARQLQGSLLLLSVRLALAASGDVDDWKRAESTPRTNADDVPIPGA